MEKTLKYLVAASLAFAVSNVLAANDFETRTFIASNKLQLPYRVAAKADPNGGKVPVVVFLHGYGQCGVDNSFTINEMTNIKSYLDGAGAPSGYKLLVPQCPNDVKWADFSMNSTTCTFVDKPSSALVAVFDLLDSYAAMADVDADRIYVTGLSMGGHGTWDAICRRPDFFAAAMPCCGGGDPACAADIAHVPVLAVHNRGDPTIPVEQTEGIVTALRALGSDVIFEKLENNSHDAWTTCYATEDNVTAGAPNHRFVWMFAQNRATNNRPKYPRIAELAAAPSGSNATISLTGVVLGTDADSVPATKYSVTYKLDGGAAATALSDQTADCSFTLEGLADGNHTCEVTITTDKGRTKTKSVVFYVNTSAASDVWTSAAMDASGSSFRTDGTLLYAYSSHGGTVNGIKFVRDVNLQGSSLEIAFAPNIDNFTSELMNEEVSGEFGVMLSNGWYWNKNDSSVRTFKLTLSGLTGGKNYLVQFLSHNYWNNNMTVSANGCSPVHIHGENETSGKYGALITGTFTAMGDTKEVTITFSNVDAKIPLNAIQVRKLPDGGSGGGGEGGATVVEPSIGSVTATPSGSTASLFLSGIVMGTDDAGTNATSYSVSYALNGGTAVTALQNQTAATASFAISNLADGSYSCEVTITTDKNKTTSKSVSFAIDTSSGGGGGGGEIVTEGWTGAAATANGSFFITDGTLLYAYAVSSVTVNGIEFAVDADLETAGTSISPAFDATDGNSGSEGVSGDFGTMLANTWVWSQNQNSATLTLKGLTAGNRYLVQILAHHNWSPGVNISIGGKGPVGLQGDAAKYGAIFTGVFEATGATANVEIAFSGSGGRRVLNAIQVRNLGEGGGGGDDPVDPDPVTPVCELTIPAKTGLVLDSVTTNGVAVAAVAGSYSIVSNTLVTVNFAAASGYEIVGGNPVVFTLAGNKTFAVGDYPIVQQTSGGGSGGGDGPVPMVDWTVATLPASDETMLRTDGTLLYAYRGASTERTLGGVTFQAGADLSSANISFNPTFNNADENAGSSSLLGTAWNFGVDTGMGEIHLTLSGLTTGHAYLLQILARNSFGNPSITIGDLPAVSIQNGSGSSGATVYGSFTAEAASHVVTFKMGGSGAGRFVAAIQVRDLGESSGGGESSHAIVEGPDTTNTLYLAKIAEYDFPSNGCGAITYSGQGGVFYVLQDHDEDDVHSMIHPLALGIDPATGAILSQSLGTALAPAGLRDAEGLAFDPLSGTLWASSEWEPPSISEFGLDGFATGRTAPVPSIQREKLRSNLSLESLTISPDGLTMWTANEQALECDGESSSGNTTVSTVVRLTRYTRETAQGGWQAAGEWAYLCDPCAGTTSAQSGLSGLCALPDGSLLALEREVSTTTCGRCRIYRLTTGALAVATEVSGIPALTNATFTAVNKGECLLGFTGPSPGSLLGPYELIVYEGIALGPKLSDGSRAVYLVSDGGTTMTKLVYGITITATTVSRICALKLTGLADEGEPAAIQDWPANPDTAITDATRPCDLGIVAGAFATSATTTAELRKLANWAKANGVPYAGADVNAMAFDADGNPGNAFSTAYLLDCAVDRVAEKKAAFRFAAFTPETVPSIDGGYNGTVTVQGASSLSDPWVAPATPQHRFFRAILTR